MLAQPRLLLVEDYQDAREMYALFLRASGLNVLEVADGEQALLAVSTFKPDIVVLDIGLPRMDGLEVTRRLRDNPATASIPIIALSATAADFRDRARVAGCTVALEKPCTPDELLVSVLDCLSRAGR